jgi:hypothetical protein
MNLQLVKCTNSPPPIGKLLVILDTLKYEREAEGSLDRAATKNETKNVMAYRA